MKILLFLSLVFAGPTPVQGQLEVTSSYSGCKLLEAAMRKEFTDKGVKIVELECKQEVAGK